MNKQFKHITDFFFNGDLPKFAHAVDALDKYDLLLFTLEFAREFKERDYKYDDTNNSNSHALNQTYHYLLVMKELK